MSNTNGFVNLPAGIYLNVRQEPNLYSAVLGSLAPKTEVSIIEQNGEWFKINYNSTIAYVFATAIKTTQNIAKGGISLNLNIDSFNFGDVGNQPVYDWNARVTTNFIQILTETGEVKFGYGTSNGDHITIIKNDTSTGLTFIQYPDQSANMYQQGWIKSSYISSDFLEFRFTDAWINTTNNQSIYTFNNSIANCELLKDTTYTLLYTVENFNISYACIAYTDLNSQLTIGFVPFSTGKLNMLVQDYPYNILNGESTLSGNPTVPINATVSTNKIQVIDVNGITVDGETISANSGISIIQIFLESQTMLIEYYSTGSNRYLKGYVHVSSLYTKAISINKNSVSWNNPNGTFNLVNLSNSKTIYNLPANQTIQYLYTAGDYACILFNNNNVNGYPLQTGYVSLTNGTFKDSEFIKSMFTLSSTLIYDTQTSSSVGSFGSVISIVPNKNLSTEEQSNLLLRKILIKDLTGNTIATTTSYKDYGWELYANNKYKSFNSEITLDSSILNLLTPNQNYTINAEFSYDGIIAELPLKFIFFEGSSLPYAKYFKLTVDSNSVVQLKLLPRYFFAPELMDVSYSENSISLDVYVNTVNPDSKFIFSKEMQKSLIIKDLSGNIITTVNGSQALGQYINDSSTDYLRLAVTLDSETISLLTENTEYYLCISFEFDGISLDMPIISTDSKNVATNFFTIYHNDEDFYLIKQTILKIYNKEFVANLHYANMTSPTNELYLIGNVVGETSFTQTTQKNLIVKNSTTNKVIEILPTTSESWFSKSSSNYSTFEGIIGPATFNKMNPNDSYNVFVSFMINDTSYEIPLCNNLNISINNPFDYFSVGGGINGSDSTINNTQLSIQTFCSVPTTVQPVPTSPTVQNPWTGIVPVSASAVWVPIDKNAPEFGPGTFLSIIDISGNAYAVKVGSHTYYYPVSSITIVQK